MKNLKRNKDCKKYLILLLILASTSLRTLIAQQNEETNALDKTKVCMVDDEYKGEQQLTTIIKGKTYFGCCDPCIQTLNADSSFRFAIDPFSGLKISKAEAYIVRKTMKTDAVIYFENKENYQLYLNKIKK